MNAKHTKKALALSAAAAAVLSTLHAHATTFTNTTGPVQQGQSDGGTGNPALNNPAVTISFSGQTALSNFDESPGITELAPGTEIVLHDGTNGAPVTYIAPNQTGAFVQLANPSFTTPDLNPGTPTSPSTSQFQIASAIALQWHAEGSVDGFYDLINDQIGYAGGSPTNVGTPISNEALRVPSVANASYINTNSFSVTGTISNGFSYAPSTATSNVLADTYSSAVYNQATGNNVAGGQNRVQFSVGEYPTEAFSVSGTASPFASPGSAGYGKGNPALNPGAQLLTALGQGGTRQQFQSSSIANQATTTIDPQTDTNYTAGPWNTAGANNISSTAFAATAVTYSANPGTGLQRLNQSDAQWLQTTGRLQNGSLFNVVARTVDTGQRVVFALNTGVDPSWAVGSNDDGNSTETYSNTEVVGGSTLTYNSSSSNSANQQHSIGTGLRLDGKTSGGEAETTISQSRMGVGALSIAEAQKAKSTAPIRALDIGFNYTSGSDPTLTNYGSANPSSATNGQSANPQFIRADYASIVSNGSTDSNANTYNPDTNSSTPASQVTYHYGATLISHYNTVKAPNVTALNSELALLYGSGSNTSNTTAAQQQTAWANVQSFDPSTAYLNETSSVPTSGIKGDDVGFNSTTDTYSNSPGDVAAFLSNIVNSVGSSAKLTSTTALDPGDSLLANGYLIPGLLDYSRQTDGGSLVNQSPTSVAQQAAVYSNYGSLFTTDGTSASNNQTDGTSATYGAGNSSYTLANGTSASTAFNGSIAITAKDVTTSGGVITGWTTAASGDTTAAGGNYLFGNFNQTGVRDLSAVEQSVNAALSLTQVDVVGHSGTDSSFTAGGGVSNSTVIPSLDNTGGTPGWVATGTNTKGDLVVLGDYNGDGVFNGQDLYLLAIGASLTSANSTTNLNANVSTFADAVRDPTDVLRKNAALNYINTYLTTGFGGANYPVAAAYLLKSGAAILEGTSPNNTDLVDTHTINPVTGAENYIPSGATDLGVQDSSTGYEEYTFDPTGANAFNPADVLREGAVDFNDAVVVDEYNGQSYENLSQSLAATAQTPVTGTTEPINLAVVQQVDGESAIGSADLSAENSALTGTGNAYWFSYNLQKTGPGTITWGRTGGTVTVYSGATFEISSGVVQVGGTVDPFSDNNASGPTAGNHVAVQIDHGAELQITQHQGTITVGGLSIDASSNSKLDVGDNTLLIQGGAALESSIAGYLKSGYNGGTWTGAGINTSAPLTVNGLNYGVGYAGSDDPGNPANLPSGTIEVKYTLLGDANLSGVVDGTDFGIVAANFNKGVSGWDQGDFNYDNVVDGTDFGDLAANFNKGVDGSAVGLSAWSDPALVQFATANGLLADVPEPTTASIFVLAAARLLQRRRRK